MAGFTYKGENLAINETLRSRNVYIGLLKKDPTNQGDVDEIGGISYIRQQVKLTEPVEGQTQNLEDVVFPVAKQNWGWISHVGLFDAETEGNLIAYSELEYKKEIRAADQYRIPKAFFIFKLD